MKWTSLYGISHLHCYCKKITLTTKRSDDE
jgi:hypothetical protein